MPRRTSPPQAGPGKIQRPAGFRDGQLEPGQIQRRPARFFKEKRSPWTQAYLGDWSTTSVQGAYGVEAIPAVFLISADGKIIESGLQGGSLLAKLQDHLK
jgi:hypothetical protein